jgi:hypothetical protein
MDLATLIFCDYIHSIVNRETQIKKANMPQLNEPYIAVQLTGFTPVVHDIAEDVWAESKPTPDQVLDEEGNDITPVNTDDEIVRGLSIVEFNVEAIGGQAANCLLRLLSSFESEQFTFGMDAYGFGLSEKGSIVNTSSLLLEARVEQRYEVKCSFYFNASQTFVNLFFDEMKITLLVKKYGAGTLATYEFQGEENPQPQGDICESY